MHGVLRAPDRHALAVFGPGLAAALVFGLVAGRWPVVAVAGVAGIAVVIAMLKDLTVGIVVFTIASFAAVLSHGGAATGAKGIGLLLVLAWLATIARRPARDARSLVREQRWLVLSAAALVAWSLLSVVWAGSPKTALVGASRYAQDVALFPIVYAGVTRFRHVRWIAAAFVAGALLATLYGVAAGHTVDGSRLVGALGDPNETAAVLVAAAVLAFALGAGERRSTIRRWIGFGASACALLGLVATASRGGLVALAVTALVAIAVGGRWRRQVVLAATVGSVLVAGWFLLVAPAGSVSHVESTQSPRSTLWTVAERAIAAQPIVGLGNDNFSLMSSHFLVQPGATTRADQIVTLAQPAHNIYLEIWADLGIVGLVLFAGVVLAALRAALAAAALLEAAGRRAEELLARALTVAIVAMLAADFFISNEYSKQLWLLLALAPAMLAATCTDSRAAAKQ